MAVSKLNKANFDEFIKNGQIVLVDFYADWCGPCKMLGPVIEELSEECDDVMFAKVNVDEEADIAARFGIMSIPTLILFKNGEKAGTSMGYKSKEDLKEFIKM